MSIKEGLKIIEGKAGTPQEGMIFIGGKDPDVAVRELLAGAKCDVVREKEGAVLWRVPTEIRGDALQDLMNAAALAVRVAEQDETSLPDEGGVSDNPPPRGTLSRSVEKDIGLGYRLGMSIEERDLYRRPVKPGSFAAGDTIEIDGQVREIVSVSPTLQIESDTVKAMNTRFPCTPHQNGDLFQFVMWRAEPELALPARNPERSAEMML